MDNTFTLAERIAFYRSKWRRDHLWTYVLAVAAVTAVVVAGLLLANPIVCCSALAVAVVAYALINNALMTYVERNAFDGSGPDAPASDDANADDADVPAPDDAPADADTDVPAPDDATDAPADDDE